ncbi:hypothetical protein ABW19_dt0205660 [Dactylella cylindrospora]|nr:hypothetical protein ABW19_dt0205660 [Dactylella cylindrospora]
MQSFNILLSSLLTLLLAITRVEGYAGYGYHKDILRRDELIHRRQVATPSPVQPGQVANCIGWRYVQSGDTCANIVTRFQAPPISLTLAKLLSYNPALGNNCQGLTLRTYVCVQVSAASTTTRTTTTTTAAPVVTPTPIQSGQVGNCIGWRYVQSTDTCANIVSRYAAAPISLTLANLLKWNPALGSNCAGLTPKYFVCVRIDPSKPTSTTTTTRTTTPVVSTPTPIQSGQVGNCIGWRYVAASDTCSNIVTRFQAAPVSLTLANLLAWNPALGSNCAGLTPGYFVCVRIDPSISTTTSRTTTSSRTTTTTSRTTTTTSRTTTTTTRTTTTTTSSGITTPTPIQSGQAAGCIGWRYVQASDTCANIVTRYQSSPVYLTLEHLLAWNPALGSNCAGLTPGYFVCVRRKGYWLDEIAHQGKAPYAPSGYQVYRNVKDFGAKGDGVTDDTAAIQNAISSGSRCGLGCDSLTTKPALVYFPPGTYMVSGAIATYYNTHLVGHPDDLPRLKATAGFVGYAIIEGNPYNNGQNWHGPTNNFYKVVRNFILDTTLMPASSYGTGIHWQVAQASSLNNIVFVSNNSPGTLHQGIYMENGSGGYMSDLVFNGGKFGAWMGNQQFTLRNITFNNCDTGIYLAWGWAWHFKSANFNNVRIGIDMTSAADGRFSVGSVVVADSRFTNVEVGIASTKSSSSQPETANSLVLDNVRLQNCPIAVGVSGNVKLAGTTGTTTISMWGQGRSYSQSQQSGVEVQASFTGFARPSGLLDSSGKILEKSKPQYADWTVDQVLSARTLGCKGDGTSDDTAALQAAINKAAAETKILYIDHGVYVVSNTIRIPPNSRIMGEAWPLILGSGSAFSNSANPTAIFKVGNPGETGFVEATNLVIATRGAMRGAILIEWNLASNGEVSGLYDVHARVGGFTSSNLDADTCLKTPSSSTINQNCAAAFMLMKVGSTASRAMFENVWLWTADHDLDLPEHQQISVFTGRGLLVESTNPIWLYGTASEHNVLYQYQFTNAANVYMGLIQTETPYYQANPIAPLPFSVNSTWNDPDYNSICGSSNPSVATTCKKSYGVRIQSSSNILCYGAGLYSFFENYAQTCLDTETCQKYMVSIESSSNIRLYNINTKGSENILTVNGAWSAAQGDNVNTFAETVMLYQ